MLSVQSLQTLRGAAAVNDCSRGRVAGALSLGCFPRYAFSRAQVVPNSLPELSSRLAPAFWLGQHAAFTRRLDSSLAAALEDDVDKRC